MRQNRMVITFMVFAGASVGLVGCAGASNPAPAAEAPQEAEATNPAPAQEPEVSTDNSTGAEDSGSGSLELTIGDETWGFDNLLCVTGLEANESDVFPFVGYSTGESDDGYRIEFFAELYDESGAGRLEGDGVEALLELILYGGAELATVYSAQTDLGWGDYTAVVEVDGGTISGFGDFVSEEDYAFGADTTEGSFTGTCGEDSAG